MSAADIAVDTSTVVPFPDDMIEWETGIPLIDIDAKVIARRLRPLPWEGRAQFFNNVIAESISAAAKMAQYCRSHECGRSLMSWSLVTSMRRIMETLDTWSEATVENGDAATIFLLSLNPEHWLPANRWINHGEAGNPIKTDIFFDGYVQKNWQSLAVFYRLARASGALAWMACHSPAVEWSDDWLDEEKLEALVTPADDRTDN